MSYLVARARKLRVNQTDVERLFWSKIRAKRFEKRKFYRQFVIAPYIVDFVCRDLKLVVELDGGQHMQEEEKDLRRTRCLESKGYRVVRFWNNQVVHELDGVLTALSLALSQRERELKRAAVNIKP